MFEQRGGRDMCEGFAFYLLQLANNVYNKGGRKCTSPRITMRASACRQGFTGYSFCAVARICVLSLAMHITSVVRPLYFTVCWFASCSCKCAGIIIILNMHWGSIFSQSICLNPDKRSSNGAAERVVHLSEFKVILSTSSYRSTHQCNSSLCAVRSL